MNLLVTRSSALKGSVRIPPNKSHSFRALIMAALAEGHSKIISPAVSSDWLRGTEAIEMLGAEANPKADGVWEIIGNGGVLKTPDDVIACGNSGIILRFFMSLCALCDGYSVLTGDHSLRHLRLCQPLIDSINHLGGWAVAAKGDGHAPVIVRGRLRGGHTEIDGMDSQPVSALLLAAALADAPSDIVVRRPGEKPWVGVTLHWMQRCGVEFSNDNYQHYRVRGKSRWKGFDVRIPLDWSAALYPIAAALVTPGSEVRLPGMDYGDVQGDKMVVEVLRQMGAQIETGKDYVIARSSRLVGREIDCNDFIDQFMLLAVIGACAEGTTTLTNAEVCRYKECDRIAEMCKALRAMGAAVEERPDGLVIHKSRLHGASLDSRNDHRMVMTLATAGMVADGETFISNLDCVHKTFPGFVEQMSAIGCEMQQA